MYPSTIRLGKLLLLRAFDYVSLDCKRRAKRRVWVTTTSDQPVVREGLRHVQVHRRVGGMRVKTVGGGGGRRRGSSGRRVVQLVVVVMVVVVVIRRAVMVMMVVTAEYGGGGGGPRRRRTAAGVQLDVHVAFLSGTTLRQYYYAAIIISLIHGRKRKRSRRIPSHRYECVNRTDGFRVFQKIIKKKNIFKKTEPKSHRRTRYYYGTENPKKKKNKNK